MCGCEDVQISDVGIFKVGMGYPGAGTKQAVGGTHCGRPEKCLVLA